LNLRLELPAGYKLNALAPSALTVTSLQNQVVGLASGPEQIFSNPTFPVTVPIKVSEGEGTIRADFVLYFCEAAKESLCYFKEARVSIPVKAKTGAKTHNVEVTYKLRPAG